MIRPDGSPGVGPDSELEASVRRRAAFEMSDSPSCVFLHYSDPATHGGEYWNVMVGMNDGPGTDTKRETWSYWNRTYEEGLRRIAARYYVWDKPWQETLREDLLYLPWDPGAAWFKEEEPGVAWGKCPNGRHLLWVIGKDPRVKPGDEAPFACAVDLARMAAAAVRSESVHPDTWALLGALERHEEPRLAVVARWAAIKDDTECALDERGLRSWHFDRAVIFAAFVTFGNHGRLDYAAYHAGCLEYAVWQEDDGDVQRKLAHLVRRHFPKERFTR